MQALFLRDIFLTLSLYKFIFYDLLKQYKILILKILCHFYNFVFKFGAFKYFNMHSSL